MRLIDADKLMLSLEDWKLQEEPISTYPKPKEFTADDMQKMIWRTIIDCECAVEGQTTLKAISYGWLKSKINAILDSYPDGNEETEILCKLLYEWEKENGK